MDSRPLRCFHMSDRIGCHSPMIGILTSREWNIHSQGFTNGEIHSQGYTCGGEWSKCGLH
jgi:hypothetical protein